VTEVPRCELPATQLATTVPTDTSDVPRASVSTASGTPRVPATGAATSRMPTARAPAASTPAPVSHAERDAALEGERENDRDAKGEEGTPERAQRPMRCGEFHGETVGASFRCANGGLRRSGGTRYAAPSSL